MRSTSAIAWSRRAEGSIEREQPHVRIRCAGHAACEHLRGEPGIDHPVAAVTEREQVTRVTRMRPDIGQTVGRHREQPFPRALERNPNETRQERAQFARKAATALREGGGALRLGYQRTIGAAGDHAMAGALPHVGIVALGTPEQLLRKPHLRPLRT